MTYQPSYWEIAARRTRVGPATEYMADALAEVGITTKSSLRYARNIRNGHVRKDA